MKEQKLKELFFEKIPELMNGFTLEKYDVFERDILEQAKNLGFDMYIFEMDGEFIDLDNNGEICDSSVLKNIYISYNSDEPFIFHEWY